MGNAEIHKMPGPETRDECNLGLGKISCERQVCRLEGHDICFMVPDVRDHQPASLVGNANELPVMIDADAGFPVQFYQGHAVSYGGRRKKCIAEIG